MKRFGIGIIWLALIASQAQCGRGGSGGAIVAGTLGGLAVGTMIGSASADSRRSGRAEEEARRAQDKAELARIEQDRQRVSQLERELDKKDLEQRLAERNSGASNHLPMFLMFIIVLLLTAMGLLVVIMLRRRN